MTAPETGTRPELLEPLPSSIQPRAIAEDIAVVIPTLGRSILEPCLRRIAEGSVWPGSLIVVDQGRSSEVRDWIARLRDAGLNAEHVPSTERGRAAGVNRGIEAVRTPFFAVTDDDCFVHPDWLERMAACLRERPDTVVTGRVETTGEDVPVSVDSPVPALYRRPRLKFDCLSGGNMGTSVRVVERVGLLDEDPRLRTAEDGEWAYRALRAGVPIFYTPDVAVRHVGWRDESERLSQYRAYARSHGGFYGKYLRRGDGFIALRAVVHHFRAIRRWVRGVLTRNPELTLYGRAYATGLLPGILAGLRRGERHP